MRRTRSQSDALIKKMTKRPGRDVRTLLSKRLISGVSINIMMFFHQRPIFLILIVQTSEKGIIWGKYEALNLHSDQPQVAGDQRQSALVAFHD